MCIPGFDKEVGDKLIRFCSYKRRIPGLMQTEVLTGTAAIQAMIHIIQSSKDCQSELIAISPFKYLLSTEDVKMVNAAGREMLALTTSKAMTAKDVHSTISNKKANLMIMMTMTSKSNHAITIPITITITITITS